MGCSCAGQRKKKWSLGFSSSYRPRCCQDAVREQGGRWMSSGLRKSVFVFLDSSMYTVKIHYH